MAKQASFQPETTMPRLFLAGLCKGSVIIPDQGHCLRSDAVYRFVRHKVYRSLPQEVMAPLSGSLSFRPDWDSPWNPVYLVVKVPRGDFPPHIFIPPWKQKTETSVFKKIFAK